MLVRWNRRQWENFFEFRYRYFENLSTYWGIFQCCQKSFLGSRANLNKFVPIIAKIFPNDSIRTFLEQIEAKNRKWLVLSFAPGSVLRWLSHALACDEFVKTRKLSALILHLLNKISKKFPLLWGEKNYYSSNHSINVALLRYNFFGSICSRHSIPRIPKDLRFTHELCKNSFEKRTFN